MMAKIKIAAGVFAAAFALTGPVAAEEPTSFQSLVKSYYDAEFQAHPVTATRVGIHDYDTLVDDLSAEAFAKNIARLHAALTEIAAIAPKSLEPMDRDDREIMIGTIKGALLDDEIIQYWRHDPDRYSRVATSAIFELVHREFAPAKDRLSAAIARERQIPALLAAGKANIEHPPRAFVEIAIRNLAGSLNFYRTGAPAAFASVNDPELKRAFATSNEAVIAAFEDYKNFLTDLLPKADGNFALGTDLFVQRLSDFEMIGAQVVKLREIAYDRLHLDQAMLKTAAKKVDPSKPVEAVLKQLRTKHPSAATLLKTAQDDLAGLRSFVHDHDIVTIPSDLLPKVEETPGFRRATTAAAMDSPGTFEQNATQAYYYVSPPDAGLAPDKLEQYLQAYYFPALDIISAHEVWPGHFMQYLTRRAHPEWSLARRLAHAQSTTEGWAHYAEQMMIEEGLGKDDPKLKVSQIEEALLRDCRFVASLEMHTAGKSVEDATQIFMKECGSPEPEARREAYRGTSDPGYMNYTIGKLEILRLRDDYKEKMGDKFSLKEFHDRFLAAGLAPVRIIRREMMGADGPLL
jgi:hypothetical protein